jgi:hypothetical protein
MQNFSSFSSAIPGQNAKENEALTKKKHSY